jgi:predicted nucleotidyltransferase
MQEKIVRKVTEIGNGAHIFAPKEWVGDEVELVRIPKKDPKQEILKVLYPYLGKVVAVFLFGSYARNEQEKDSDIDVFVISDEKFNVKSKALDIVVVPEKKIEQAKKLNPILYYSMLREAKQVINSSYLERLKKEKINLEYFKDFIKDTQASINSSQELIDMDKKLKNKNASESVVYSLILRLRGIFIMNLLLNNGKYSKNMFKKWIAEGSKVDYSSAHGIYQAIRNNKKPSKSLSIEQAESLLLFLKKELNDLSKNIK